MLTLYTFVLPLFHMLMSTTCILISAHFLEYVRKARKIDEKYNGVPYNQAPPAPGVADYAGDVDGGAEEGAENGGVDEDGGDNGAQVKVDDNQARGEGSNQVVGGGGGPVTAHLRTFGRIRGLAFGSFLRMERRRR